MLSTANISIQFGAKNLVVGLLLGVAVLVTLWSPV